MSPTSPLRAATRSSASCGAPHSDGRTAEQLAHTSALGTGVGCPRFDSRVGCPRFGLAKTDRHAWGMIVDASSAAVESHAVVGIPLQAGATARPKAAMLLEVR